MKEFIKKICSWLKSVYSETDGTGSSSRILTSFLAMISSGILVYVFYHVCRITDVAQLTAWLSSIPIIISALVLFFTAPYGVNKGSGSITDILSVFKK